MPHRILYEIVSSAHKTSMCLGKKGADPPCTSYHRGCPAGRSPLAKQRLTRFDQVLNSGSKDRISFRWSGSDAELNEIPPLTADINQHYSFNTWSKALELDLYMWRRPTSFDLFQLDQLRTRTGQRVGVASLPSQMSGISELHVRTQLLAGQQVEPPLIQVHIDHGGAVLKWAEGINDKVGSIEAAAVHWGGRQTPTWNLSLVSFLPRNGLDMIYWLRMCGVLLGTVTAGATWCYMHVIRKL